MPITLELPGALARYSDHQASVAVKGSTVAEALSELWRRFPELQPRVLNAAAAVHPYLLVSLNDEPLPRRGLEAIPLRNGDRLEIVALAEGG